MNSSTLNARSIEPYFTAVSIIGWLFAQLIGYGKRVPPTGKSFDLLFTTIARWKCDKLAEEWVFRDSAPLLAVGLNVLPQGVLDEVAAASMLFVSDGVQSFNQRIA
jgi:hypothetical protein